MYSPRHRSDSVEGASCLIIVAVLIDEDIGSGALHSLVRKNTAVGRVLQTVDDKLGL